MGVTTCAIIEIERDAAAPQTAIGLLNGHPLLAGLVRRYDAATRAKLPQLIDLTQIRWEWTTFDDYSGPLGSIYLHENLAELSWCSCPWGAFVEEPEFRELVVEASRLISKLLLGRDSSATVFVPDSLYAEARTCEELDQTMPQLLSWLNRTFGPPTDDAAAIRRQVADDDWEYRGYYVVSRSEDSVDLP